MSQWIGQSVSIECNDGTVYQGVVNAVDSAASTVNIQNAIINGKPSGTPIVSLLAGQIKNLEFVQPTASRTEKPAVFESSDEDKDSYQKQKTGRRKPANVLKPAAESAQEYHSRNDSNDAVKQRRRSNSFTGADTGIRRTSALPGTNSPMRYEKRQGRRQEDCFAINIESCMDEFDFEKNLALFDKQKVFGEIENSNSQLAPKQKDKYKHDEMVIKSTKVVHQIKLMDESQANGSYTTDDGLVIPCISYDVREQLFIKAASYGYTEQRRVDIISRNICDMVFQLIGGSTRMTAQNNHQKPTIVVLCSPHIQGCYGVACARHLSNHNINTIVFSPTQLASHCIFTQELSLYDMCGAKRISHTDELPATTVDLIINCMESQEQNAFASKPWYKYVINWCNTSRAHVLAIDPSTRPTPVETKWSVHIALPQRLPASAGQTYLCDAGLPKTLFKHIGIKYRSPFAIKFCIPLQNMS